MEQKLRFILAITNMMGNPNLNWIGMFLLCKLNYKHFFAWESVWGKILTVDTLIKRRWQMVNRCNFCKESEELADHILIHCTKRRELWIFLLALFGVAWVFPNSVRNLLFQWKVKGFQKKNRAVWCLAPIFLFWCVWKECNWRIFKDELSDQGLKDFFF